MTPPSSITSRHSSTRGWGKHQVHGYSAQELWGPVRCWCPNCSALSFISLALLASFMRAWSSWSAPGGCLPVTYLLIKSNKSYLQKFCAFTTSPSMILFTNKSFFPFPTLPFLYNILANVIGSPVSMFGSLLYKESGS